MIARAVAVLAALGAITLLGSQPGVLVPEPVPEARTTRQALPLTRSTPAVVCPGPETMVAPLGGQPVAPGGPVQLRALVTGAGSVSAVLAKLAEPEPDPALGAPPAAPRLKVAEGATAGAYQGVLNRPGALHLEAEPAEPADRADPADPADEGPTQLAMTQTTLALSGDLRGLVGTTCDPAASDLWLVGGGTGTGRRGRLVLTNPTATPAVVDITVLGPDGPVQARSGRDLVVAPRAQSVLLLDALAPGLEATAVHVVARQGRVGVTLHDSLLRGLVPGGVDDVPVAAAPSREQLVPGVWALGVPVTTGPLTLPTDPRAPGAVAVRVAVPGPDDAIVRVRLLGESGPVQLGAAGVRTVAAGSVVDIPITGVPLGAYAALIEADVPVVAGALVGRAGAGSATAGTAADPLGRAAPAEFGWAAAATPLTAARLLALPVIDGRAPASLPVSAHLAVTGGGQAAEVTVTELTADGRTGPVHVVTSAPQSTAWLKLPSGLGGLLVEPGPGGSVHVALGLVAFQRQAPMISVAPVSSGLAGAQVPVEAVQDQRLGIDQASAGGR